MADDRKNAPEEAAPPQRTALFENKVVLLGVIVVVQALLAFGLTQFVILPRLGVTQAQTAAEPDGAAADEMPRLGKLVSLEEIIVTLAGDTRKPRYLRINVSLEVENQVVAEVVASRLPQLRDVVIMALSDKTPEQLSTAEGRKGLRDEIFRRLDEKMPPGALMNVYFADLVVQ